MTDKKSHNYFDNLFDKQIDMKFGSCFGMQPRIMSGSYCMNLHKLYSSLNSMTLGKLCYKHFDIHFGKILCMVDNHFDNLFDKHLDNLFHKQIDNFGLQFGNMPDKLTDS